MDAPVATSSPKYIRLLPYWAVLQTDLRQTLRGVYDLQALGRMMGAALVTALAVSLFGVIGFARSDV